MSKSELAFLTARLCKLITLISEKSKMLEDCIMICIIYAMHRSKRTLTPMIYNY
jgi:hypothetical protein